jgi:hypothetical protein
MRADWPPGTGPPDMQSGPQVTPEGHSSDNTQPAEAEVSPSRVSPGGDDGRACWFCGGDGPLERCCADHPDLVCADRGGCRDRLIARLAAGPS